MAQYSIENLLTPITSYLFPSPTVAGTQVSRDAVVRKDLQKRAEIDTLAPAAAKREAYKPSKPRLPPELGIIGAADRFYQNGNQLTGVYSSMFEQERVRLEGLCNDHIEKMREAAKLSQEAGVWSYLQKIGSGVLSVVSIFLGIQLATSSAAVYIGGALIGAGIVSLANLALTEAGFYDAVADKIAKGNEDWKRRIRHYVPLSIALMTSGVQFASLGAIAIFGTLSFSSQALLAAQTLANVATTVGAVGEQVVEAKVARSQGDLTEVQGKLSVSQHTVDQFTEQMKEVLEEQTQARRSAKHIVDLGMEAREFHV